MTTTEQDIRELQELGQEIAGELQPAGSQPRCVCLAFASQRERLFRFTMQVWIDLEYCRSPLLELRAPESPEEIQQALRAFGTERFDPEEIDPADCASMVRKMLKAVREGFGMRCAMVPPQRGIHAENNGMGGWLPMWANLVTQCGLDPDKARQMDVAHAFALIAGDKNNRLWTLVPSETPYQARLTEED